jgi:hypothetical protein
MVTAADLASNLPYPDRMKIWKRPSIRLVAVLLVSLFFVAACDGDEEPSDPKTGSVDANAAKFSDSCGVRPACPVFASSEKVVGKNRFLIGLLNDDDAPMASPKIKMHVKFFDLAKSAEEPRFEEDLKFIWTVKGIVGLYAAEPDFDVAGPWGAEVTVEGPDLEETIRQKFLVEQEPSTPAIGAKVPASDTPTADDVASLEKITTDTHPDPKFYETSVADAVKQNEPFVLVFATPKFCQTQFCGPTLGKVKRVSKDFPNVTFIHSEIYKGLSPDTPPVDALTEWGLPSEPWVFVVDSQGKLVQKYEVAFSPGELRTELSRL